MKAAVAAAPSPLVLPTQPNTTVRRDPKILLIYGPPKIGKTTMLSQLQTFAPGRHLIMETEEGGTDYVSCVSTPVRSFTDYSKVCDVLDKQRANRPYDFLCIDTIDPLEEWAEAEATRLYKASPIGGSFSGSSLLSLPKGGGFYLFWETFTRMITRANGVANNLILVGHIRDKFIEAAAGKTDVSRKDLDLTGKLKSKVCSMASAIGYVSRDADSNITISFVTSEELICGSRCPHLKGQKQTHTKDKFDWAKIYPDYAAKNGQVAL